LRATMTLKRSKSVRFARVARRTRVLAYADEFHFSATVRIYIYKYKHARAHTHTHTHDTHTYRRVPLLGKHACRAAWALRPAVGGNAGRVPVTVPCAGRETLPAGRRVVRGCHQTVSHGIPCRAGRSGSAGISAVRDGPCGGGHGAQSGPVSCGIPCHRIPCAWGTKLLGDAVPSVGYLGSWHRSTSSLAASRVRCV
jgi:hypothetical protein